MLIADLVLETLEAYLKHRKIRQCIHKGNQDGWLNLLVIIEIIIIIFVIQISNITCWTSTAIYYARHAFMQT